MNRARSISSVSRTAPSGPVTTPRDARQRAGAVTTNVSEARAARGGAFLLSAHRVSELTAIDAYDLYRLHGDMGSPGHFVFRGSGVCYTARGLVQLAANLRDAGHVSAAERLATVSSDQSAVSSAEAKSWLQRWEAEHE